MPSRIRRSYLQLIGTVATVGITGCLDISGITSGNEAGQYTAIEPTRCRGDPVSVERTVSDPKAQWEDHDTAMIGRDRAVAVAEDRLGAELIPDVDRPGESTVEAPWIIVLGVRFYFSRNGELINTPTAPFSELVEVAPRTVTVTVSFEEDTVSTDVPVFAKLEKWSQG